MTKQELSKLRLDFVKICTIGNKYFNLYNKHIPIGITGNILIYDISNVDCIVNIIKKNPLATYFIYGNSYVNQAIACINETWDITFLNETFDLYNINMKFDFIIMNPPYNRGFHIKILDEAKKHVKDTGTILSLQPIVKWQESLLFDSRLPVDNTCVLVRYTMDESSRLFNSHQRCELGLISIGKTSCTLVDNIGTLLKIKTKLKQAISAAGLLVDKLEDNYKDFPVNFGYGVTIAGNGGHGKACYRIVGMDEVKATRREEIGHCIRYNAKDKIEQHLIYSFYTNQLIRFIAKEFGFGGIPYKILPFAAGFIDENGNTPLDEEWTFEKLVKWFELDYNDLVVIRKSLDTYLHPEEEKIIDNALKTAR